MQDEESQVSTVVKPGGAGDTPGVLVRLSPQSVPTAPVYEPDAPLHAPTLMSGGTPGSGGQVRVWSPRRKALWTTALLCSLGLLAEMALRIALHGSIGGFMVINMMMITGLFLSIQALRRPTYLTTDDTGIGITTAKGSKALRWGDILTARWAPVGAFGFFRKIILSTPEVIEIVPMGYSKLDQEALMANIVERSGLQQLKAGKLPAYTRVDTAELGNGSTSFSALPPETSHRPPGNELPG